MFRVPFPLKYPVKVPCTEVKTTFFDSSDSAVDTSNECRLPTSKYVRLLKANPVKLKRCWLPNTVVGLLPFPLFRYFVIVDSEVEIVAHMNCISVWAHIVFTRTQVAHDPKVLQPCFFVRFTQDGLVRPLSWLDSSGRNLQTGLL